MGNPSKRTAARVPYTRAIAAAIAIGSTPLHVAAEEAATGANAPLALEEIVVTARRREENLQSVPVAVSVLTGNELLAQGGLKIDSVGKSVPNVHFEAAGGTSGVKSPEIFIRGMGQSDFIPVEDPAVGIYIDGVYMGRNIGSVFDLVDVERVEVLRGPQGTLFGRNTIGGAVNIISRSPGDQFGGSLDLSLGDDGYQELRGTVNFPMGDRIAGRLSAFVRERDGYVKALQYDDLKLGDDDVRGLRGRFTIDVTDTFSLDFSGDYSRAKETPGAISTLGIGTFNGSTIRLGPPVQAFAQAWNAVFSGAAASCTTLAGQATDTRCYGPVWNTGDRYENNSVFTDNNGNKIEATQNVEVYGGSLTATLELGPVELKSITSLREFDISFFNDLDFSPYILFANNHDVYEQEQLSQELQVSGDAMEGRLNYVGGFYYFEEEGVETIFNQIAAPPPQSGPPNFFFQGIDRAIDNDSHAFFGQVNYDFTDALTLTVGARYTESNKDFVLTTRRRVGPTSVQTGKLKTTETTPLVSLTWDAAESIMVYGTWSEGYRDGSYAARFTGAVPEPLPSYDPEYVNNYEVGVKSKLFDNRMRINASVFLMDYEDMQISASSDQVASASTKENLGDASINGLELEVTWLVHEYVTVGANIGLLDDKIDSLKGRLTSNTIVIDKDSDLPMTPDWTLSLNARFDYPLASGANIFARADFTMKDDFFTRAENLAEIEITDYRNLNLNAGYITADETWELSIGMRNATDENYYESITPFSTFGLSFGQPVRPRTTYASVKYNFGQD